MATIIYNDIHCFSPIALMTHEQLKTSILKDLGEGHTVISLGDNVDIANCLESDLNDACGLRYWIYKNVNTYYSGNHELETFLIRSNIPSIHFTHGDFEKWGTEKALKYRSRKPCASKFKRKFIIPLVEWAEQFGVNRATEKFIQNAVKITKANSCHTYVCGHIHPKKEIRILRDGIRILVLPRGRNVLNI